MVSTSTPDALRLRRPKPLLNGKTSNVLNKIFGFAS